MGNRTFLTERDRYFIEISLRENIKVKDIADILHKSVSCIYKEIRKGTVEQMNSNLSMRKEYLADYAQARYEELKQNHGPGLKIGNDRKLSEFIEHKIIHDKLSPYAVSELIKQNNFSCTLSHQTIYSYIDKGVFLNLTNVYLPVKSRCTKQYRKRKVALNNLKGESIEKRPVDISCRSEFGHWELDSVIGKQGQSKCVLTVFTERLTRFEIIFKSMNKSTSEVVKHLNVLERKLGTNNFRDIFKTITVDNGSEFLDYKGMEKCRKSNKQRTKVYYCHPYSSYERGSNENQNRLIRRWYPKGYDLDKLTDPDVYNLNVWINHLPRRLFKGKCSFEQIQSYLSDSLIALLF